MKTLEEVREQYRIEAEAEKHKNFLASINGKTASQLNLRQMNYVYELSHSLFEKIVSDNSAIVENIEFYEAVKGHNDEAEANIRGFKAMAHSEEEEAHSEAHSEAEAPHKFTIDDSWVDSFIDEQIKRLF